MTRDEEAAAIERFLATRAAARCPTAYVSPTSTNFSPAEEARRLAGMTVRLESWRDVRDAALRRFFAKLAERQGTP